MIRKIDLLESSHNVDVNKLRELTKQHVMNYMLLARRTREYVKFSLGNSYIMVQFNRDGSVHLLSNIRFESAFQRELYRLDSIGFNMSSWAYFISYWMNRFKQKEHINNKRT